MTDWRTCRLCVESCDSDRLVKYGTRAYGHAKCLLKKHGVAVLGRLSLAALEQFPVLSLRGHVPDPVAHLEQEIAARRARLGPRTEAA